MVKYVSQYLFGVKENSKAGIAAYGYVPVLLINLELALNGMVDNDKDFSRVLEKNTVTTYTYTPSSVAE